MAIPPNYKWLGILAKHVMSILIKSFLGSIKGFFGKTVPLKVEHIPTFRCNFKCSYCGLWNKKSKELSTKEIKVLMDKFSKAGTVSWNFTGGEPLLRRDIKELVEYAKFKGFYVTLNSNGILIKNNLDWIKKVDLIGISLDGTKEVHNKTRGQFDKVLESIKLLKEIKANVYICTVMNKLNLKNRGKGLKEILNLAKALNIKIAVLPIFEDKLNNIKDLKPTREEFEEGLEILKEFKKERNLLLISWSTLEYLEKGCLPFKCLAGKFFCTIYPDGKVSPCMFMPKVSSLKDLKCVGKVDCNSNGFHCQLCYLEYNNLFSLKPKALYTFIKNYY